MKNVVDTYENYREEDRFIRQSKRIEFITTTRILDEHIKDKSVILDCAAGTGVYSFYLADKGHIVTATDLVSRHIAVINNNLSDKPYNIKTSIVDVMDMSMFDNESFDVVLNMGPLYHLTTPEDRERCLMECVRVLKKGGLLFSAYIPRYNIFQYVAINEREYMNADLSKQLVDTGVVKHDDKNCFWTDAYFSTPSEMVEQYSIFSLKVVDHFSQDGITPFLKDKVDSLTSEQFEIWCDNHYMVCREQSQLGSSNHVVIVGKK